MPESPSPSPQEMGYQPNTQPHLETATLNGVPQGRFAETSTTIESQEEVAGYHPRGPVTDSEIESALAEVDAAQFAAPEQPAKESVAQAEAEQIASPEASPRSFAAEQEATFKALEINGRLSSDSASILELSNAIGSLNPESATSQKLSSRILDKLISDELQITDPAQAGELFNVTLKYLENPQNNPEIVAKLDNNLLAMFSHDQAKFNLTQLQQFSAIAKERYPNDERFFKAFDAKAALLVDESMPDVADSRVTSPSEKPTVAADKANERVVAAEAETSASEDEAVQPQQPTVETDAENLQAEIDAEQDKYHDLKLEIQSSWRELPPSAQNSLDLSRLPKKAGFLDLTAFTAQLEQRMDNSHLQANREYAGLNGEGQEVTLARQKKINEEFEKVLNLMERAKLNSPEVTKGVAEADKIRAKHSENLEKMQSKLSKHLAGKPWLRDLVKLDPHVQKNPYFSRFGSNELGLQ